LFDRENESEGAEPEAGGFLRKELERLEKEMIMDF
jgi:hypothetical protein